MVAFGTVNTDDILCHHPWRRSTVGCVFLSHRIGGAASTYLAGWLFDVTGSGNGVFLAGAGLLLLASAVSGAVQERRYSLKYQTAATRVR